MDEVSTALLLVKFYENLRNYLKNYPELKEGDVAIALQTAQNWLRNLTSEEGEKFLEKIQPQIEEIFKGEPILTQLFLDGVLKRINDPSPHPFAHPYDWAAFTATGF